MKDQLVVDTLHFAIEHCRLYTHNHVSKSLNHVSKKGYPDCEYALFLYLFEHFWTHLYVLAHFSPNFMYIKDSVL
jgi:hypothetical protein